MESSSHLYASQFQGVGNPLSTTSTLTSQQSGTFQRQYTDETLSEGGSECCGAHTCSPARITLCKRMLALANDRHPPAVPVKGKQIRNTGALGPLLSMIDALSDKTEADTLCNALDTLAFMTFDRANRKTVLETQGMEVLLSLFQRSNDSMVLCNALAALSSLTKGDNKAKEQLWSHPGKVRILALLRPGFLCHSKLREVLCLLRKLAFTGGSSCHLSRSLSSTSPTLPAELIDSGVLFAVAEILLPSYPHSTLTQALRLVRMCAEEAGSRHIPGWHAVLFRLVPLLHDLSLTEMVLDVLLALTEHLWCKNIFCGVGAVPPLLALLTHPSSNVCVSAACIISCLSDQGLSREQLCREGSLLALLRAMQLSQQAEVCIGVVFTLTRLCGKGKVVTDELQARGATRLLQQLLNSEEHPWEDEDLVMGAQQLIACIGEALPLSKHQSVVPSFMQGGGGASAAATLLDLIPAPAPMSSSGNWEQAVLGMQHTCSTSGWIAQESNKVVSTHAHTSTSTAADSSSSSHQCNHNNNMHNHSTMNTINPQGHLHLDVRLCKSSGAPLFSAAALPSWPTALTSPLHPSAYLPATVAGGGAPACAFPPHLTCCSDMSRASSATMTPAGSVSDNVHSRMASLVVGLPVPVTVELGPPTGGVATQPGYLLSDCKDPIYWEGATNTCHFLIAEGGMQSGIGRQDDSVDAQVTIASLVGQGMRQGTNQAFSSLSGAGVNLHAMGQGTGMCAAPSHYSPHVPRPTSPLLSNPFLTSTPCSPQHQAQGCSSSTTSPPSHSPCVPLYAHSISQPCATTPLHQQQQQQWSPKSSQPPPP